MEFTLKYRGPLKSAQSDGTRKLTHMIRRAFHPQLEHQWKVKRELSGWLAPLVRLPIRDKTIRHGWYNKLVGKHLFAPLVIVWDEHPMIAELDIRILWRDRPGNILRRGDIGIDLDNRLKVLLDALTVPQTNQLVSEVPIKGEEQTFCLLEDDRLVVKLTIAAEPLTTAHELGEPPNFADISVHVLIRGGQGNEVPFETF